MEGKINELLEKVMTTIDKDSDAVVLVHKGGKCGAVVHGNIEHNAMSMFSCMHQTEGELGTALYNILKLNVLNILGNPSPYADDLLNAINNLANSMANEVDEIKKNPHMTLVKGADDGTIH